jgi:hypothetical protein
LAACGHELTSPIGVVAFGTGDFIDGVTRCIESIGNFIETFAIASGRLFLQLVHFYRKIVEVTRDFVKFSIPHGIFLLLPVPDLNSQAGGRVTAT